MATAEQKQTYLLIASKHHVPQGVDENGQLKPDKVYSKGDTIELTEVQAKALTNKVVLANSDEAKIARGQVSATQVEADAAAQAEIERLKEALKDKEAELEAKTKELAEFVE